MNDNATPENMSKLARLIAIGQPLNEQTVSEAIDLCVTAWRADKAEMANMALARRANVILMQRLEAAETEVRKWDEDRKSYEVLRSGIRSLWHGVVDGDMDRLSVGYALKGLFR